MTERKTATTPLKLSRCETCPANFVDGPANLPRLLAPHRQFISVGIGEMEASASGKAEGLAHDFSAGCRDFGIGFFQGSGIDHDQRAAGLDGIGTGTLRPSVESSGQTAVVKAGVIRPVILKVPAKDLAIETLSRCDVGGGKLDVVDPSIMLLLGHFYLA